MKKSTLPISAAILSALALTGCDQKSSGGDQPTVEKEKCWGVARAGKNDCASGSSSCAGTSKTDADPTAWIYLEKGACDKIANGTVK